MSQEVSKWLVTPMNTPIYKWIISPNDPITIDPIASNGDIPSYDKRIRVTS